MAPFQRKFLAILFLGLYGLLSASGPSLHSFPAFDHGESAHSETKPVPERHGDLGNSHDDCLVCHFLAQGQIHHDLASQATSEAVASHPVGDPSLLTPHSLPLQAHPRAPPLV